MTSYSYSGTAVQSIGRSSDFTGDFVAHSTIGGNDGALFSPNHENDDSTLSVNSLTFEKVNIYPNPAEDGFVNISSESAHNLNVEVYNILGKRLMYQKVSINQRLNISKLATDVYLVKISDRNQSTTKKLVIQ